MSDLDGIRGLIDGFEDDPMLAMSQGSKELFHSDLLAWYLTRFPILREAVLDAWGVEPDPAADGTGGVRREWRHLDLVVDSPGRQPLVVENKMFSLPNERQLDAYTKTVTALQPAEPSLVLLSLTDPGWRDGRYVGPHTSTPWIYRSYQELMQILYQNRRAVDGADDGFAGVVLDRWLAMLGRLRSLVEMVGRPGLDEPLDLDGESRQQLQRLRLDAPVQKMRFQVVATQVHRRLAGKLPDIDIDVGAGLSNRAGFVGGFADRVGPRLGWQIQQRQFRLAFVVPVGDPGHGRTEHAWQARYEHARRYADYFDFDAVRELVPTAGLERPEGQPLGFQRFNPDFAYRYVPVPGITVGQAIELGVRYMQRAHGFQLQQAG
ncbi:PD-(D/E)XK nuclease family protein [Actinoallomurus bryophytorum]|nr:PD-(D/E)XK nuclease family protein [Actinoallomurus bryophytorum]